MEASMGIGVKKTKSTVERKEAARRERIAETYGLMLATAISGGEPEPLDWMLAGDWVQAASAIHFKPALVACAEGDRVEAMKLVLSKKSSWSEALKDGEVFAAAVSMSAMGCVEALVDAGAGAIFEGGGESEILVEAMFSREDIHRHALVRRMIELGAAVDGGEKSNPPLCMAAMRRDKKSVELLLAAGADIEIRTEHGASALILATEESDDDMGMEESSGLVEALLKAGANVDALDWYKESALHNACASGAHDSVKLLLEAGAKPWQKNRTGQTPLDLGIESIQEKSCMAFALAVDAKSRTAAQWFGYAKAAEDDLPDLAMVLRSKGEERAIGLAAKGKKSAAKKVGSLRV